MPKPNPPPKNQKPFISLEEFSVDENAPNGTPVGTVSASDPDSDPLTYSIVIGKKVSDTDGVFRIDPATGEITVANGSFLDYESLQTRSLTVRVTDPAGASAQATFAIAVNDVDEFSGVINLASLDGTTGFRIDGVNAGDRLGTSVSSAGDINGDGVDDLIVGAPWADPGGESRAGSSYVVFGIDANDGSFPASFNLMALNGSNGFRMDGINVLDTSGRSVSSAGDVNGDGFDDLIIGAHGADPNGAEYAGQAYVVFGGDFTGVSSLDVDELNGSNGFQIDGINRLDVLGYSVSSAGDVNGDGFGDLIIGAYGADPHGRNYAGESYVIFGKDGDFPEIFDLSELDGTNGFVLQGSEGQSGLSVSSAGDVNGDGFDDLIIGAPIARAGGDSRAGSSYVVFGKDGDFSAGIDLSELNGTNGFRIDGIDVLDGSGYSVSSAGDVNGDGFDDLIIGAPGADAGPGGSDTSEGESYVVFGKANFSSSLDLATLNGSNGFRIDGIDKDDYSGGSVSSAGDVNNDGKDDLIIGASYADPGGKSAAGESYVVFGKSTFSASLNVAALDGSNGFRIDGIDVADTSGSSVSSAGDINKDGYDDLIIGAPLGDATGNLRADAGESYVIFGRDFTGMASLSLADADVLM